MKTLLLSASDDLGALALYIFLGIIGILVTAALWRWIFDVSKFLNNQRVIGNTLREILEELKSLNKQNEQL